MEGGLTRALLGMGGWKWLQNSRSFFKKYWERRYSSAGERNSQPLSATPFECCGGRHVVVCSAWVTNISTCHTHLFKVVLAGGFSEPIQLLAVSKQPVFLLRTAVEHVSLHA